MAVRKRMSATAGSPDDDMAVNGEIRRLRHQVVELEALLGRFHHQQSSLLAMAVHDLRTPLTIIQGYAQLLSIELTSSGDPTIDEYTTNILAHAESLGNMIENLVALDQVERGQLRLSSLQCDLNVLVDEALAQVEGLINGDEHQIRRGLYNLLSHTIKYARPHSELHVNVDRDGPFYCVRFLDPQRNLPEDVLLKLFDAASTQQSGTNSLHGIDLGLILVHHVAESPSKGMTLVFCLPASIT